MKYVLLLFEDESRLANVSESEFMEYKDFTDDVKQKGSYLAGEALQPTSTATVVKVREGKTLTTDGPYAETKEQLGGFYMLECENLDEAIAQAARIPCSRNGSIEIRPVMEFEWPEEG